MKIALILSSLGMFASEVTLTRMNRKIGNFGKQLARNLRGSTHPCNFNLSYILFMCDCLALKHIIRTITLFSEGWGEEFKSC